MSYLDLALLGLIVIGALLGLLCGFYRSLISFGGWVVAFILAFFITSPIVRAFLDIGKVRDFVVGGGSGWSLFEWIYAKLPEFNQNGLLGSLFKSLIKVSQTVANEIGGSQAAVAQNFNVNVALMLSNGIFSSIIFVCLLIVIRSLLLLLTMFANAMAKDKLKGASNRVFGMLIGLVKGFCFSGLVMVALTFIMGVSAMDPVRTQLDKSVITAPIYTQVSRATDKIMSGGKKRLEFLRHARGFDNTSAPEQNDVIDAYVGSYVGSNEDDEGNEFNWTLTLKADKTFTLTSAYAEGGENINMGSGTFDIQSNGSQKILVLEFADGKVSENEITENTVLFSGMSLIKQ